jgi:hypothetical protein
MKYAITLCTLLLALALKTHADPLNKQHVSADAKWLIHLDCDNLRQTQVGGYLLNHFVEPHAAELANGLKLNVSLSNILQHISSLTAYGTEFNKGPEATGVLLINTDEDTQKVLVGVLAAQILAATNGPVKEVQSEGRTVYSFNNQVFISPQKGGPIAVSRSLGQLETAGDLFSGKGPNLASSKAFAEYPNISNSFFFVGVANVVDLPKGLPVQAKVLQMADGGRVALGEKDDRVFLDLSLRAKTADVTRQIQQVFEGIVALVSLGQPDNPELMDLAKSTKVSSIDQLVTISVQYPTNKLIARLNDQLTPKGNADGAPQQKIHKAKKKKNQQNPPAVQPEAEQKSDSSQ